MDDEVIDLIKSRQGEDGLVRVGEDFRAGDKVVINEGPLKDLRGVFEGSVKEHDRVSILLSTVSYQGRVVLERAAVKRLTDEDNSIAFRMFLPQERMAAGRP